MAHLTLRPLGAGTVTGSKHLRTPGGAGFLVGRGLFHGLKTRRTPSTG